jgi:hypothetical protein
MATQPQWVTPERRRQLIALAERFGGGCIYGDKHCDIDEHHWDLKPNGDLYNPVIEGIIESWRAEDRERRSYEWKLFELQLNDGTYGKYGSSFDPVARDVFFTTRPEYYLVGIGVSPFTPKQVALIRVPSTFVHLFVDCGGAVQEVNKNARRKMKRYGKVSGLYKTVHDRCTEAARDSGIQKIGQ